MKVTIKAVWSHYQPGAERNSRVIHGHCHWKMEYELEDTNIEIHTAGSRSWSLQRES